MDLENKIDLETVGSSDLLDAYYKLKEIRADISKQDKELKAKQERIENELSNRCIERGEDGLTVGNVRVTRYIKRTAIVDDSNMFLKWALANERQDMLSVKAAASPLKEFQAKNDGNLPDGMVFLEEYKLSITKK